MKIRFEKTCMACPEQYDAFIGEERVGYLRLRHGHFTVACPDVGGELIYEGNPEGDGEFTDNEREFYLWEAEEAIKRWIGRQEKEVTEDTKLEPIEKWLVELGLKYLNSLPEKKPEDAPQTGEPAATDPVEYRLAKLEKLVEKLSDKLESLRNEVSDLTNDVGELDDKVENVEEWEGRICDLEDKISSVADALS